MFNSDNIGHLSLGTRVLYCSVFLACSAAGCVYSAQYQVGVVNCVRWCKVCKKTKIFGGMARISGFTYRAVLYQVGRKPLRL